MSAPQKSVVGFTIFFFVNAQKLVASLQQRTPFLVWSTTDVMAFT
jgi:hypothetical protein